MPSHNTTNSSPPRRATVSVARTGGLDAKPQPRRAVGSPEVCPKRVVHDLEPVQVYEQHSEQAIVPPYAGECLLEADR